MNLGLDTSSRPAATRPRRHAVEHLFPASRSNQGWLGATALSAALLLLLWIPDAAAMLLRRRRDWTARTAATARVHTLVGWTLLVSQLAAVLGSACSCRRSVLRQPGAPVRVCHPRRSSGAAALALAGAAASVWRNRETTLAARLHAGLASAAAVTFACTARRLLVADRLAEHRSGDRQRRPATRRRRSSACSRRWWSTTRPGAQASTG